LVHIAEASRFSYRGTGATTDDVQKARDVKQLAPFPWACQSQGAALLLAHAVRNCARIRWQFL